MASPVPRGAVRVEVTRLPSGVVEADSVACGGAARDPDRRRAGRGDDAHARARRGARARLLPHRGHPAPPPRRSPPTWRRTRSRSTRRLSTAAASSAASTPRPRAASAARARSRRWRSRRPRVESPLRVAAAVVAALPDRLRRRAGGLRRDGRAARDRALRRRRRGALHPRGRGPPQRDGQGDRLGLPRRRAAARRSACCA